MQYILKIKEFEIPFCIKNYKTSKSIKIYFKEDCLMVTKSPYVSKYEVEKIINKNKEKIYEEYKKIRELKRLNKRRWETGQNILYHGEEYTIYKIYDEKNIVKIKIDEENKMFKIILPSQILKDDEELYIRKAVRKLFKENTELILKQKLVYWSKITNISYNSVKVRDAKTKYGSCKPKTRELHFSSRLIMLNEEVINAIIVHELCHIIHPNHSKDFYNLVESYIPNYKEINKYLKKNSKMIEI